MKHTISGVLIVFCLIFLASCGGGTKPTQVPKETTAISEKDIHMTLPSGLIIDAYELEGPPETEPLTFTLVSDKSLEQILAMHEEDRKQRFADISFIDNAYTGAMSFGMKVQFGESELVAVEKYTKPDEAKPDSLATGTVEVFLNDEVIYSVVPRDGNPVTLRGLWSSNQDWILEYAYISQIFNEVENSASFDFIGHLVKNGVSLNEQYSYEEAFGFQWMQGKPFYFFEKNGQIGVSFDENETMLGFEKVEHYGCCSAGFLNPTPSQNMLSFFAQKDNTWFYVEIGVYQ
jgi:hypothetical protein